jgi:uncharacterized protein (TIGR03067 family)
VTPTEGDAMRTFALTVALLALAGFTRADDTDPEPPGASLRRLQGTWKTVRILVKGREREDNTTYTFDKDQVTYAFSDSNSKGGSYKMTVKVDRERPDLIEMKRNGGPPTRCFFKIDQGELYLVPARSPKAKPDFTGKTAPVRVLKREKKD